MLMMFALGMTTLAAVIVLIKDHKIMGMGIAFCQLGLSQALMYMTGDRLGSLPWSSVTEK
ncbi:hypothetical protein QRZ34_28815 [Klebsiella michiganensis]|jgi:hypothetical protein|uniref:hypothetical protein n=1 Tax=Klebsiella michiganensis TaxID=1134687 RepID=UPI0025704520|nr:hypothetical protein [Klebsiella michiganensis]MDL4454992.1 hypothetical protein [Klebsiella michiganensis]